MNTSRTARFAPIDAVRSFAAGRSQPLPAPRDFGTGYGRSSGYAAPRRYRTTATLPPFRVA